MTPKKRARIQARRLLQSRFKGLRRKLLAEARYLHRIGLGFRWSLGLTGFTWTVAAIVLHEFYPSAPGEEAMEWDRAAYYVLVMTAFEAALEYHTQANWAVKATFFALPLLGLFVIIDAIVRFTQLMFERRRDQKEWQELLASTYKHHVIVCGLGHVGFRIVQQLVEARTECVVVEQQDGPFVQEAIALGVPVIMGDIRLVEQLQKAGVQHADAIILATDQDLTNIEVALTAKELAPQVKTIVRLFDQRLAKRVEKLLEIDHAFSTSALAAPLFAAAATSRNVINAFVADGLVLNTVEMTVRAASRLEGRSLGSVQKEMELTFLMLKDVDEAKPDWNPQSERILRAGAKLLVVTEVETLRELEAMNQGPR